MGVCLRFAQTNIKTSQLKIFKAMHLTSVPAFGRPTYIGRPTFQSFGRPTSSGRPTSHMQVVLGEYRGFAKSTDVCHVSDVRHFGRPKPFERPTLHLALGFSSHTESLQN